MPGKRTCPRCQAVYPGTVPPNGELACDTCGHRWKVAPGSDEYMPAEPGTAVAVAGPLTQRKGHASPPAKQPSTDGLPFDKLEAESASAGARSPLPGSDLAFHPSTEPAGRRTHCPVCGHGFSGKEGDEQNCPQCGTAFSRTSGRLSAGGSGGDRLIGRVLRGCQIDRKLGEGGMGAVYHARQLSLDRSVAIKVLPPELARNRNFIQRFEREAKSLARINHANILQIYDFGEDPQLGVYFMVIEYVDGWDLGEVLRRQPTLSQVETLDIVRQALLGLEQAAEKGVIHRDIKPDNLMVAASGLCKVSDFGLAKGNGSGSEVTSVGVRVGTPAFMSPEQCDGVEVDSRSDVYNLGCTAYLMLTGRLPFDGETPFAIMLKHKVDPVPSPQAVRPSIDPRVDSLIRRMLAKRPDDRCRDLRELIDDAEQLLVELTGTASVLRKTNGPIRALVEHSSEAIRRDPSGAGSGARGSRGDSPRASASPGPARSASPGSGGAGGPIPEWLRPVDGGPPLPPPPASPATPPAAGSRTGPAPAIGSRTGPMPAVGSRSAPVGSRTGPAPAVGSRAPGPLNTPFPGAVTPYPGVPTPYPGPIDDKRKPSSSTMQPGAFDRARERGIKAEVASIAAGADRLASDGRWDAAASEWRRAAQLARDSGESRRLSDLAAAAGKRARTRRRMRALLIVVVTLVLAVVNLWIWPPVVHGILADRELARLQAIPDHGERTRRLREFAGDNQDGWPWYRQIFMRGYPVRAAAAAAEAANAPPPAPPAPPPRQRPVDPGRADPPAPARALAEVQRLAADPAVPLQQVVAAARDVAGAEPIRGEAEKRLAAANELRARIDAARAGGRHGEALDLAQQLATAEPRAGALLDGLPLPGRVRASDADSGAAIADLRLAADGVPLAGGDGRFCRAAAAETRIEVAAAGYVAQRVAVTPGPEREERLVEVRLSAAPVWRTPALPRRPAWIRLVGAGPGAVAVLVPDGVSAIDAASGTVRVLTLPGTRVAPWWSAVEGGWGFVTADGEQRQVLPGLDRAVPVRQLGGAPIALIDVDLVYRAGARLAVSIEAADSGARSVIAREGPRQVWRFDALVGKSEPLLRRGDDRLVVVDDAAVHVLDEEGAESARLPLRGPRLGPWTELSGGRILVATQAGVELIQLGAGGARIVPAPWLAEAGPAVPAGAGDAAVLARSDRNVDIAEWPADGAPHPRWRAQIAGRPALASVGNGLAAVADEAGAVTVIRLADGVTVRRIASGGALAAPPLILPGTLVVAGQDGAVAGYRF